MENRLLWDKRYNIGVEIIDREHKKLFGILDKLFDFGRRAEKNRFACREAIKYFKNHAIQHFSDEEAYMSSTGYPGLEAHRRIHRDFRERTLPVLESELEQNGYSESSIHHFLSVCAEWLIGHTLIEDHMIVSGEPIKHWEGLLPEDEQAVMEQTITGLLHSMFRLDSKLISCCYAGEQFGDGYYCRLVYSGRDNKKLVFFLLFEEPLIRGAIGSVTDAEAETAGMMLSNVARYAAKQLAERVRQRFSSLEQFEMAEEQLLSYEQFRKMFERQSPQFSLLFDTGRGYFAYCMTASRTPRPKEQILTLAEADAIRKEKILVVDDSVFMRKAMLNLLGGDYEVLTADSGLSAIRSITLSRPDLILLDYEMPVCSGSQVLEMIRSEKDFADIPVIFLTCRVDRESVKKAISLKPEGYLSKSLPVESVKKEIDRFFEKEKGHHVPSA